MKKFDVNDYSLATVAIHYLQIPCEMQNSYFGHLILWIPTLVRASAQKNEKIIVRPQNHWKSDYTAWNVLQERFYRTKISNVDELKRRINNEWAALKNAVIELAIVTNGVSVYALAFVLKANISSIWCKHDAIYYTFDNFWETITVIIQWFISKYCVDGSVLTSRISQGSASSHSREVGNFCIFWLRVYSRIFLPIYI